MNTGACMRIGRQPPIGLKPSSFWSFIISWLRVCRSFLYFSRSAAILGCTSCILRWLCTCLMKKRNSSSRMVTTRKTIDRPQVRPLFGSIPSQPKSSYQRSSTQETAM